MKTLIITGLTVFALIGGALAFWTPAQAKPCAFCPKMDCWNSMSCPYGCTCIKSGTGPGFCASLD